MTVGMSHWPMDRLVVAAAALADQHDVFVQAGASAVRPQCPTADFIGFDELRRRIAEADVVVTHAGNTVRLVQQEGKVPIVVAREASRGEVANGHQEVYAGDPDLLGPAVVLSGDLHDLAAAVARHPDIEPGLLAAHPVGDSGAAVAITELDRLVDARDGDGGVAREDDNPFRDHPLRRYAWAWSHLAGRTGRHLELGIGDGAPFVVPLAATTKLDVVAVDAHAGYLHAARRDEPKLPLVRTEGRSRLPFAGASFDSATALDVLEHVADEDATLAELARVLRPGGLLVLTVPAQHFLSALDADNAKLRFPRVHRGVYGRRFAPGEYRRRFVDPSDGLRGDMAWNRHEHTNYRAGPLIGRVAAHGFVPRWRDGANLVGRVLYAGALLGGRRAERLLEPLIITDGRMFHQANLFLTFERQFMCKG